MWMSYAAIEHSNNRTSLIYDALLGFEKVEITIVLSGKASGLLSNESIDATNYILKNRRHFFGGGVIFFFAQIVRNVPDRQRMECKRKFTEGGGVSCPLTISFQSKLKRNTP